jgi:putative ABC transport system permease protein
VSRVLRLETAELLRQAVDALLAHRLRATLSAVGIVLGIATVITALALGEGARRAALSEIGVLGVRNIFLKSAPSNEPLRPRQPPSAPALRAADADLIARTIDGITAVAAVRLARSEVRAGAAHVDAAIAGVSPSWAGILNHTVARGRWLSSADARERRRVAVIGASLAQALLGNADAVGSRVAAAGTWFLVVGVLAPADVRINSAIALSFDPNQSLMVPLGAMDVSLGQGDALDRVQEIVVRVDDAARVEPAAMAIAAIAARKYGAGGGYEIVVPRQLLAARLRARRTFDVVLGAVGFIALLISGVGIMNIMMASVAERTHEIGVRRAVGARRADVLTQFAFEAAVLCLAGGLAGIPLGVVMAIAVAAAAGWPLSVSAWSIGLAVALAASVGLVFGVYPALVASRVHPIEALRAP